jgi:hypothetical protein
VSTPEQHHPPVYACAAGAVAHAHAGDALEPAVLLHTFVPAALRLELEDAGVPRVDISTDGPGAPTLTLRVLVGAQAVSWQLPIAPFVAALPGQLGDDGRMVLLAVVDGEPQPGFWAQPIDCEELAAELALPVADLAEALEGRLISWLSADLEELLHLDAHDRVSAVSPAQTLADAVIAHYRGDLSATQEATRVVRALELGEPGDMVELGARLSAALAQAVASASPTAVAAARDALGPFEAEALRLLDVLPRLLAGTALHERTEATMTTLLDAQDRDEAVRAAVSVTATLVRADAGPALEADAVLLRLGMVDDAGLARLARLWVSLAVLSAAPPTEDALGIASLLPALREQGPAARQWLRGTALVLSGLAMEAAGRASDRVADPLAAVERLVADEDGSRTEEGLGACLALARFVRQRAGFGPGAWLIGRAEIAAQALGDALVGGLDLDSVADLLVELVDDDVEAPDLIDAFLCAASMLLVDLDPQSDPVLRQAQVTELLEQLPGGARGTRWMLDTLLREAPEHDPLSVDLRPMLPPASREDPDRAAQRAGRHGVVRAGLRSLQLLAAALGQEAHRTPEEVVGLLLATGLDNHDLLRHSD